MTTDAIIEVNILLFMNKKELKIAYFDRTIPSAPLSYALDASSADATPFKNKGVLGAIFLIHLISSHFKLAS